MSILTPEVGSVYGALDSTAFADGDVPSAHVARLLARSANRLLCRGGEPLINQIWDSGGAVTETPVGGFMGFASPAWEQILPGPITCLKRPGLTKAKLNVRAYARSGEVLYVQVVTTAATFNAAATGDSPNCLKIDGNGAWQWHSKSDIPIDYGPFEGVSIFLRGVLTSTAGSTGTYGSPNNGAFAIEGDGTVLVDLNATWSLSPSWASGGHGVAFIDGSSNQIFSPQKIVEVPEATRLVLHPGVESPFVRRASAGGTYAIRELPRYRFANLSLYPQTRTA